MRRGGRRVRGTGSYPDTFSPTPWSEVYVKNSGEMGYTGRVDKAMQLIPGESAQNDYSAAVVDIDTGVIAAARSNHSWPRLARTTKLMTFGCQWDIIGESMGQTTIHAPAVANPMKHSIIYSNALTSECAKQFRTRFSILRRSAHNCDYQRR